MINIVRGGKRACPSGLDPSRKNSQKKIGRDGYS